MCLHYLLYSGHIFRQILLLSTRDILWARKWSLGGGGLCCGWSEAAEVNQDIVDFVFSELSLGDCQKEAVRVDNFQSQLVAGKRYKFDLVSGENSECGLTGQAAETCHVEVRQEIIQRMMGNTSSYFQVYNVPWMGTTEILWDATSCQRQ